MRLPFLVLALLLGLSVGHGQAAAQTAGSDALARFDAELKRLNAEAARNKDAFIAEGEAERAAKAPRARGEQPLDTSGADLAALYGPESDWVANTHNLREVKLPETDCRYRRYAGRGGGDDFMGVDDRYLSCPVFKFEFEGPDRQAGPGPGGKPAK